LLPYTKQSCNYRPNSDPHCAERAGRADGCTYCCAGSTADSACAYCRHQQYTLDMIATAGSALIDAGKLDQLMQLLAKFGVDSLTNLAPASYGAVATELRALGARI